MKTATGETATRLEDIGMDTEAMDTEAIMAEMKNQCVDISRDTSISAYRAHFSLWNPKELCGVGRLVVPWNRQPVIISETAFTAAILEAGRAVPVHTCRTDRRLYGYEYTAEMGGYSLSGSCAFFDSDSLLAVFRLQNRGAEAATCSIRICGESPADTRPKRMTHRKDSVCVNYNAERTDSRDPLPSVDMYYCLAPDFRIAGVEVSRERRGSPDATASRYRMESEEIRIEPDSSAVFSLVLCLGIMNRRWAADHCRKIRSKVTDPVGAMDNLKHEQAKLLQSMPPLPRQNASLSGLYHHCGLVLLMNSYGPFRYSPMREKNTYYSRTGVFPNRGVFNGFWIEDSSLHVMGLREWLPQLAEEQILLNLDAQDESGRIPMFPSIYAPLMRQDSQNPILGWACWSLYRTTGKLAFLEKVYPVLSRYNRWWFAERDRDGDGLCEFCCGEESGNDNSPRWDSPTGEEGTGAREIEAVDLASFLIVDMKCLSRMAAELKKREEADFWSKEAALMAEKVLVHMYDEQDNLFYDIRYDSHEHRKVITPMNFMPLWAGVPLDEGKARRMIESCLLNEGILFGRIPFPSVAYSEPTYRSDTFWRGPTWICHVYYMLQILSRYGYHREAETAAKRILDAVQSNDYIYEWYDSQTGDGSKSVAEYSWSASLLIEIILKRFAESVV